MVKISETLPPQRATNESCSNKILVWVKQNDKHINRLDVYIKLKKDWR